MFQFIQANAETENEIIGSYDPFLVILSFLVAFLGSYSVLAITGRIRSTSSTKRKGAWIVIGAIVFGTGIWAMHFLGMLAFRLGEPVNYSFRIAILSVLPPTIAGATALPLIAKQNISLKRYIPSGFILGAGISIMHYTDMTAMEINAAILYHLDFFLLSILVAIVLAILALWVNAYILSKHGGNILTSTTLSALILSLAVTGMHYTAMTAVIFIPTETLSRDDQIFNPLYLGLTVLVVSLLIITLATVMTIIDSRFQKLSNNITLLSNRLFEAIESITDGFLIFDNSAKLLVSNSSFRNMYPEMSDVLNPGTPYKRFLGRWASLQNTLPDDVSQERFVQEQVDTLFDQGQSHEEWECQDRWLYIKESKTKTGDIVSIWSDVTKIKELQLELEKKAFHDALTGLPNRDLFHDRIEKAIAKAKRFDYQIAVMYLDLDGFKPVNDTYGHKTGDFVLKVLAGRIASCIRDTDTAARLGGDEFAVLLDPKTDRDCAYIVANRILYALRKPIHLDNGEVTMGVSIGICLAGGEENSVDSLIRKADAAMYEVKTHGKNEIKFHNSDIDT